MNLFPWFLFAHVLGAIIAFGPTFSFPIIGAMADKEREHGNFATRVSERLTKVQVVPLALLQGITGVALIVLGNIDVLAKYWLLTAIVLYLFALGYAILVQGPTVARVIELTRGGPPAGGPAGSGGPAGPGGPPPELPGLIRRVQRGGAMLTFLIVTIVFLMVVKPF